uniref:Uncharacterized protein n=1 Tax=Ditylum brightwellii TaxID=49249 RepID=A0A7S4R6N7_9STRA
MRQRDTHSVKHSPTISTNNSSNMLEKEHDSSSSFAMDTSAAAYGEYAEEIDAYVAKTEKEEEEFRREVNVAKVSMLAYEKAAFYLNRHEQKQSANVEEEEEREDAIEENRGKNGVHQEKDALVKQHAKQILDLKARACLEAVHLANYFKELRKERHVVKNVLFQELLTVGKDTPRLDSIPLKKKKTATKNSISFDKKENTPTKNSKTTSPKKKKTHNKKGKVLQRPSNSNCIKSAFPPFQYTKEESNTSRKTPASSHSTTAQWMQHIVKWRIQRRMYMIELLDKCGCPDCIEELNRR